MPNEQKQERRIIVDGVWLELTEKQITSIENEKKRRDMESRSWERTLKYFGFKPIEDLPGSYETADWYAQLFNHGGWQTVWVVGPGLKSYQSFPGGWVYESPKELSDALAAGWQNISK